MSQCKDCNRTFSYQEVFKAAWGIKSQQKLTCTQCGKEHKISVLSRFIVGCLSGLVGIFAMVSTESIYGAMSILLLYVIAAMLVAPFLVKFSEVTKEKLY